MDDYFDMLSGAASAIDDWAIVAFYGGKLEGPGYGSKMTETDPGAELGYFVFEDPNISDMLLVAADPSDPNVRIAEQNPGDKTNWESAPDTLAEGSNLGANPIFKIVKRGDVVPNVELPEGVNDEEATCEEGYEPRWIARSVSWRMAHSDDGDGETCESGRRYTCVAESCQTIHIIKGLDAWGGDDGGERPCATIEDVFSDPNNWLTDPDEPDRSISWRTDQSLCWSKTASATAPEIEQKIGAAVMVYHDEDGIKLEGGLDNPVLEGDLVEATCDGFDVRAKGVTQEDSDWLRQSLEDYDGCAVKEQEDARRALQAHEMVSYLYADTNASWAVRQCLPCPDGQSWSEEDWECK